MNVFVSRYSPLTAKLANARFVSSTLSLSFETRESLSESTLRVETLDITNLPTPITIRFQLDTKLLNPQAPKGPRCMYYDVKKNEMSDQGVITRYDTATGRIECDAYHLTDFAVVEFETNGLKATTMEPNLDRKDLF